MSTPRMEAQLESYKILKDLLHKFRATLDPHLDETSLSRQGVDVSKFDLQEETGNEGTYFLPAAQSHVQALRERPSIHWDFMHGRCNIGDSMEIDQTVGDQFFRSKVGPTNVWAHELTPWRGRRITNRYERHLSELKFPGDPEPTRQNEWHTTGVMEAEGISHQICFSIHEVNNVTGLIRSELMIVTSLMLAKMRRTWDHLHKTYPILMLSTIGRHARFIQAHMCPLQQRLKVSYSQLFHFDPCTQETMDLFTRWLFSSPLTNGVLEEPSSDSDVSSDSDDNISQLKATASSLYEKRKMHPETRRSVVKFRTAFSRLCCMSSQ